MLDYRDPIDRAASRSQRVRKSNNRIARSAIRYRFVSRVPFLCECDDEGCDELVLLTLEAFYATRLDGLRAAGHIAKR
jgi:hypothetical protein